MWLESIAKKPMHYDQLREKIRNYHHFTQNLNSWKLIIQDSFHNQALLRAGAVVPCYGITPKEIEETLESLKNQTYPFNDIVVVLNEPCNQEARQCIASWVATNNSTVSITTWHFLDRDQPGKRGAMVAGFRKLLELGIELIVNVDGDTSADVDALANTVRIFLAKPDTSLLTSNVRIKNLNRTRIRNNMLKLWTYFRYDYANNIERGAQSFFLNVTCGSGPWLALRANLIDEEFINEFLTHSHRGFEVRPGDDRFVTRMMNRKKLTTVYSPDVLVWTDCPENWKRFRSQQSRRAQSAHINFVQQTTPAWLPSAEIWRLTLWSISDTIYLGLFTYIILGVFTCLGIEFVINFSKSGFEAALWNIMPYVIVFFLSNFWRGLYTSLTNNDWRGMVNAFYFLVVFFVITPEKIKRLNNLTDMGWGGRIEAK